MKPNLARILSRETSETDCLPRSNPLSQEAALHIDKWETHYLTCTHFSYVTLVWSHNLFLHIINIFLGESTSTQQLIWGLGSFDPLAWKQPWTPLAAQHSVSFVRKNMAGLCCNLQSLIERWTLPSSKLLAFGSNRLAFARNIWFYASVYACKHAC